MDITLTASEQDYLESIMVDKETLEDALHRVLLPFVVQNSEVRLQHLANAYRSLTPDLQIAVIKVIEDWQSKLLIQATVKI